MYVTCVKEILKVLNYSILFLFFLLKDIIECLKYFRKM